MVPTPTPEFVRWAIAQSCPLREFEAWQEPEQVERRLRPLRAYSEAVAEGRLFEGICVAPSVTPEIPLLSSAKGFRASEVLEAYGGLSFASRLCGECPANALRGRTTEPLAGCHGLFDISGLDNLHSDLEAAAGEPGLKACLEAEFLVTTPRWYGLWIESPPSPPQLATLVRLFRSLSIRSDAYLQRLTPFLDAATIALETGLPLHLTLVPRGEYTATKWTVVSHCGRCRAFWPADLRRCPACGRTGHPDPGRRRNVRGDRPYWRLTGFLGANAEPFLKRYFEFRQQ